MVNKASCVYATTKGIMLHTLCTRINNFYIMYVFWNLKFLYYVFYVFLKRQFQKKRKKSLFWIFKKRKIRILELCWSLIVWLFKHYCDCAAIGTLSDKYLMYVCSHIFVTAVWFVFRDLTSIVEQLLHIIIVITWERESNSGIVSSTKISWNYSQR